MIQLPRQILHPLQPPLPPNLLLLRGHLHQNAVPIVEIQVGVLQGAPLRRRYADREADEVLAEPLRRRALAFATRNSPPQNVLHEEQRQLVALQRRDERDSLVVSQNLLRAAAAAEVQRGPGAQKFVGLLRVRFARLRGCFRRRVLFFRVRDLFLRRRFASRRVRFVFVVFRLTRGFPKAAGAVFGERFFRVDCGTFFCFDRFRFGFVEGVLRHEFFYQRIVVVELCVGVFIDFFHRFWLRDFGFFLYGSRD